MNYVSPSLARELSENTAWLRRIANSLVGTAEADDLVQETMEVALRQPPSTDRPIKPWLRVVLTNAAKGRWRASSRRQVRETAAASPEPTELADAGLQRLEMQQELVRAVIALDALYRQAIILRFVDGLSASEIAAQLGLPASTVRSRIKRGLQRLRADLDHDGSIPTWRAVLAAPAFSQTPSLAATPALIGGITMKLGIVLVGIVMAVVAVVVVKADSPASSAPTEAAKPTEPIAAVSLDSERKPWVATPATKLRRFKNTADRARFAAALTAVRQGKEREKKTYDVSGTAVEESGEPPPPPTKLPGKLDKEYIRERLTEVLPLLRECYEIALENDPELAGTLTIEFVVDAEEEVGGYVREAQVAEDSSLGDPVVRECITETILSLEFIPPQDGGEVRVRYPFTFLPAAPEE